MRWSRRRRRRLSWGRRRCICWRDRRCRCGRHSRCCTRCHCRVCCRRNSGCRRGCWCRLADRIGGVAGVTKHVACIALAVVGLPISTIRVPAVGAGSWIDARSMRFVAQMEAAVTRMLGGRCCSRRRSRLRTKSHDAVEILAHAALASGIRPRWTARTPCCAQGRRCRRAGGCSGACMAKRRQRILAREHKQAIFCRSGGNALRDLPSAAHL